MFFYLNVVPDLRLTSSWCPVGNSSPFGVLADQARFIPFFPAFKSVRFPKLIFFFLEKF
jgi:hypothetical protein